MPGGIVGIASGQMRIEYAASNTQSITALLTQVSGITGSTVVKPVMSNLPEFSWSIAGGPKPGNYDINRNDYQGLSYWSQAYDTVGPIGFDQFYNYDHRTFYRQYDGVVSVNPPFPIQVELILNDNSGGGDSVYFGSAYSNTGGAVSLNGGITTYSYFHNQPNTSFTHTIRLTNTGPNPEFAQQIDLYDLDTGYLIYAAAPSTLLPSGMPVDFSHSLEFFRRYYITIVI